MGSIFSDGEYAGRMPAAPRRPDPPPYRSNDYAPVIAGTLAWLIAFVVLLTRHDEMARNGQGWWLWVSVVGFALGLWGMVLVAIHHRVAARRATARQPDTDGD
jgi:hypothetical protein